MKKKKFTSFPAIPLFQPTDVCVNIVNFLEYKTLCNLIKVNSKYIIANLIYQKTNVPSLSFDIVDFKIERILQSFSVNWTNRIGILKIQVKKAKISETFKTNLEGVFALFRGKNKIKKFIFEQQGNLIVEHPKDFDRFGESISRFICNNEIETFETNLHISRRLGATFKTYIFRNDIFIPDRSKKGKLIKCNKCVIKIMRLEGDNEILTAIDVKNSFTLKIVPPIPRVTGKIINSVLCLTIFHTHLRRVRHFKLFARGITRYDKISPLSVKPFGGLEKSLESNVASFRDIWHGTVKLCKLGCVPQFSDLFAYEGFRYKLIKLTFRPRVVGGLTRAETNRIQEFLETIECDRVELGVFASFDIVEAILNSVILRLKMKELMFFINIKSEKSFESNITRFNKNVEIKFHNVFM